MTPDELQEAEIERIVAEPTRAALIAHGTGVGKTLIATEVALRLGAQTVLIITPKNVIPNWEYHFTQQQGFPVKGRIIDGTKKGVANFYALKAGEPGVYMVGREFMALSGTDAFRHAKDPETGELMYHENGSKVMEQTRVARWSWSEVKPDIAIYDEVHAAQNRKSANHKALKQLKKAGFKLAMSGTPSGNKFMGFWAITRWLWPDLIDTSYHRWVDTWCETEYDPFTYNRIKAVGEKEPKGRFVASLPLYFHREPEKGRAQAEVVYVDLTAKQRKMFKEMAEDALVWLDDNPLVADLPITKGTRLRQMTLGEVTFNEDGEVDFAVGCKSAKLDMLESLIADDDEPALIFLDSQKFIKVVLDRLGPQAVEWSGQVSQTKRADIMDRFGKDIRYIVATIPSISEGTDGLQRVARTEYWLSESLNGLQNIQAEGRLDRTGQTRPVRRTKILARDTHDDDYFNRLVAQRVSMRASMQKENS